VLCGEGVEVERSADVKDEIVLRGNNINSVSQTAANIQQVRVLPNECVQRGRDWGRECL
jgi:large subunit ribosomal protein L9e